MRHRKHVFKIGRRPDHVRAVVRNQVCSLIFEERIRTTLTKAKEVRRHAEKMVTLGKSGTLHHRRRAIAKLHNVDAVRKLFSEISPRYSNRTGGYTRIVRLETRRGDGAPMCYIEFLTDDVQSPKAKAPVAAETDVIETVAEEMTASDSSPETTPDIDIEVVAGDSQADDADVAADDSNAQAEAAHETKEPDAPLTEESVVAEDVDAVVDETETDRVADESKVSEAASPVEEDVSEVVGDEPNTDIKPEPSAPKVTDTSERQEDRADVDSNDASMEPSDSVDVNDNTEDTATEPKNDAAVADIDVPATVDESAITDSDGDTRASDESDVAEEKGTSEEQDKVDATARVSDPDVGSEPKVQPPEGDK